ncbi:MAG: hypothetical protein LC731_00780 [Acidobacteria bacterium]|nr:hypothetical protein [Acidobacteriota bacterium]
MGQQKKSKYDTNPLDPDVARRTDDAWGAEHSSTGRAESVETEDVADSTATRNFNFTPQELAREDLSAEAPTRRYDNPKFPASYPSVFVPPVYEPPSAQAQSSGIQSSASVNAAHGAPVPSVPPPTSRQVANINLPENIVLMLPYLPFPFIGAVVAAVLLFLVPRTEPRARFHAAQGLALHMIVVAFSIVAGIIEDFLSGPPKIILDISSAAFSVLAFIFFVVSMIRVYKGDAHVVAPVSELTRVLNEKIEPRK